MSHPREYDPKKPGICDQVLSENQCLPESPLALEAVKLFMAREGGQINVAEQHKGCYQQVVDTASQAHRKLDKANKVNDVQVVESRSCRVDSTEVMIEHPVVPLYTEGSSIITVTQGDKQSVFIASDADKLWSEDMTKQKGGGVDVKASFAKNANRGPGNRFPLQELVIADGDSQYRIDLDRQGRISKAATYAEGKEVLDVRPNK